MKVVITGTSSGIGRAAAIKFLREGHSVYGIDIKEDSISDCLEFSQLKNIYRHFIADISDASLLPQIDDVDILVNNAGIQTEDREVPASLPKDIQVNLLGTINVTQKYAFQKSIKSVLFNASVSALTGDEFPSYVASKAGIIGYMKYTAIKLAKEYQATCNALCFGGILTSLNDSVVKDRLLWQKIMDVTPLKRWASAEEAAEWIYFMTVVNKACTGQAIEVSNGERNCQNLFVWPEE
ncbi:MAG: SDR family oxidoreductase [Treponema sp.]|nr:SDR family oxidoreductase [Treponema sp.]